MFIAVFSFTLHWQVDGVSLCVYISVICCTVITSGTTSDSVMLADGMLIAQANIFNVDVLTWHSLHSVTTLMTFHGVDDI